MTKKEVLDCVGVARVLLKDLEDYIEKATKNTYGDEKLKYLSINRKKVQRNRLIINEKLKQIERYNQED